MFFSYPTLYPKKTLLSAVHTYLNLILYAFQLNEFPFFVFIVHNKSLLFVYLYESGCILLFCANKLVDLHVRKK